MLPERARAGSDAIYKIHSNGCQRRACRARAWNENFAFRRHGAQQTGLTEQPRKQQAISWRAPDLGKAGLSVRHGARVVELADAPGHHVHGLHVAQHAHQLLLVDLQRRQRGAELPPLTQVPARAWAVLVAPARARPTIASGWNVRAAVEREGAPHNRTGRNPNQYRRN